MIDVVYDRLRLLIKPRFLDVVQAKDHEKHYQHFGCVNLTCREHETTPVGKLLEPGTNSDPPLPAGEQVRVVMKCTREG